jgi:rubrerythrin
MSAVRELTTAGTPRTSKRPALVKGLAMNTDLTLIGVDRDGAIEETADRAGVNRAELLRRGALDGGAILGAASLLGAIPGAAFASSKGSTRSTSDVDILNFALTLEYLEAAFYAEALKKGALKGPTLAFAKVVAQDEAQHVAFLKTALGMKAVKKPAFDFKGTTAAMKSFQSTAIVLEDTGVSAYAGAAPMISNKKTLSAALSVHSVEARHAAWIRNIVGMNPAPVPFDAAHTKAQVLEAVTGTGFITG